MKRTFLAVILSAVAAVCGYAQKVDNSLLIPGMTVVTQEQDLVAMAAISALTTQSFARVYDSAQPSRYLFGVVNGTGTVFEVTGPFTNLMVTLSEDFEETVTHTRPAWTNNVFPFTESQWVGGVSENTEGNADYYYIESSAGTTVAWSDTTETLPASLTLVFGDGAGTATVSVGNIYYTTNAIKHFSTEAELEAAKAACGVVLTNTVNEAVSNLTADITSATNALMPYTRTVYGDVSTTNETEYAAFNATNAAVASYSALIPSSAVGAFTNIFRYNFNGVRKFGTLTNTAWFLKSGFGAGYKAVSTVVSVKDAAGNVLASSASQPVNIDQPVTTQAAITNTLAIPLNIYSGTVEIACIAVSTNASFSVRLYSGAQYTNIMTFSEAPMAYATYAELGTRGATNVTANGVSGNYDEPSRTLDISAIVPSGIVTNGWIGDTVKINNLKISKWPGGLDSRAFIDCHDYYGFAFQGSLVFYMSPIGASWPLNKMAAFGGNEDAVLYFDGTDMIIDSARVGTGKTRIKRDVISEGSLTVAGTNTAAEVRSNGGYSIFDAGSNCYWRVTASNGTFYASDTNGVRKFKFTTEAP